MLRLLTAWLLLMLALPFVSPLLASAAEDESTVPICCRRGGAHHCLGAMDQSGLSGRGVRVSAPHCAEFPRTATPRHASHLLLAGPTRFSTEKVSLHSTIRQVEARARVALDRARRKRGPPTLVA